ncbi:hypothetical protein BC832DRAFT_542640 [Gaertneriomyces semiglobifer]|nr:hypothetical protein BC832DRAFT_542640 [Gaertneriomyces semiglobifer]
MPALCSLFSLSEPTAICHDVGGGADGPPELGLPSSVHWDRLRKKGELLKNVREQSALWRESESSQRLQEEKICLLVALSSFCLSLPQSVMIWLVLVDGPSEFMLAVVPFSDAEQRAGPGITRREALNAWNGEIYYTCSLLCLPLFLSLVREYSLWSMGLERMCLLERQQNRTAATTTPTFAPTVLSGKSSQEFRQHLLLTSALAFS